MKVGCDVCHKEEATIICWADEAALCKCCDARVHAANKLAGKHERLPLFPPSPSPPLCDICQEKRGYFFCLQDRALLCRQCDYSVHSINALVAAHQRYLMTGVRVGLEPSHDVLPAPSASQSQKSSSSAEDLQMQKISVNKKVYANAENVLESLPEWRMDDFLNISDFDNSCGFYDLSSSKADIASVGEEWSAALNSATEDEVAENYLALVPEIPSPPTASGLYWPKKRSKDNALWPSLSSHSTAAAAVVPDIECHSLPPDSPFPNQIR